MNTKTRSAALVAGVFAIGALAGPTVSQLRDGGISPSADATTTLQPAGEASLYVPVQAYRALDTRSGIGKLDVDMQGKGPGMSVFEFFADLNEEGELAIPNEAIAVSFNVTVAGTEGIGFLEVRAANTPSSGASTINWFGPDQRLANSGNVLLGAAGFGDGDGSDSIDVEIGGASGAKAHVIIDITGYYVPAP